MPPIKAAKEAKKVEEPIVEKKSKKAEKVVEEPIVEKRSSKKLPEPVVA